MVDWQRVRASQMHSHLRLHHSFVTVVSLSHPKSRGYLTKADFKKKKKVIKADLTLDNFFHYIGREITVWESGRYFSVSASAAEGRSNNVHCKEIKRNSCNSFVSTHTPVWEVESVVYVSRDSHPLPNIN